MHTVYNSTHNTCKNGADFLLDHPVGGHLATTINYDVQQIFRNKQVFRQTNIILVV